MKRVGHATVWKICDVLNSEDNWNVGRIRYILDNPKSFDLRFSKYDILNEESHWERFVHAINLFKYCPVLDEEFNLRPLNAFPPEYKSKNWGDIIGFDPLSSIPVSPNMYKSASLLDGCSFHGDGSALDKFDIPVYTFEDNPKCIGRTLPPFARCHLPVAAMAYYILLNFVGSHVGHYSFQDRKKLEKMAASILKGKQTHVRHVLEPSNVPKLYARWQSNNIFESIHEEPDWSHDLYYDLIKDSSRVPVVNEEHVKMLYPNGNENKMERAIQLVFNGNVDVLNMQWRKMKVRANQCDAHVLQCFVVPSMKSKVSSANEVTEKQRREGYLCYLSFGKLNICGDSPQADHVTLLEYPYSCCGCVDGRGWCSHLGAILGTVIQIQESSNKLEFESTAVFPSPLLAQNLALPIEFMSRHANT